MTRSLIPAVFCCISLHAQFNEMVTTDDGGTLLFRSAWRFAGSGDTAQSKIFRWDAKGFSLVFSAPDSQVVSPPYAFGALLTGDGRISGYGVYPGCSGAACTSLKSILVLNGATAPATLAAFPPFQVSRDGRYLAAGTTVVNLSTGAAQTAPGGIALGGRFGIGNNGGLLMLTLHQVFILSTVDLTLSTKPGVVIANSPAIPSAVVSAAENRVIYEVNRQLWSYDVAAGQSAKLAELDAGTPFGVDQFQPSISNDGSRVLYRRFRSDTNGWEAVVQDFRAATTTVIARILPGAENLVISGDGKSAWLHRVDGRLVRIAIDSLQASEVPGRHAWMAQQDGAPVYGSFHHLYGGGFAPDDTSGAPPDLSVDLAGLPFPIVAAGTRELDVQISWDAPAFGQFPLTMHNSSSPFESVLALDLERAVPTFERSGLPDDAMRSIQVVHEDFHGVVTAADPALPGEYLHAYMTGLGDVQPRPATGSPPAGLSFALRPLCWLGSPFSAQEFAPVAFAGLAPGTIGIYQVDIGIPADFPPSVAALNCVGQPSGGELAGDSGTIAIGKR
jgi:uncharacterized protein (TIGR03437 family)